MKLFTFIILLLFLFVTPTYAVSFSNLPLRGQGDYKWLFLKIYEAKLWAEKGDAVYSGPLVLELKYYRDFKGSDIAVQSGKELMSAGNSKEEVAAWESKLKTIFPNVKEGDSIQAKYQPNEGIIFYLNQSNEIGRISDIRFAKKFLDIWIGENTTAPDLRKKLLGENL